MIELKVEEYCHDCKAFKPVSETVEYGKRYTYDMISMTEKVIPAHIQTTVKCEYAKRCAGIARYIRGELKEKLETESETIGHDT